MEKAWHSLTLTLLTQCLSLFFYSERSVHLFSKVYWSLVILVFMLAEILTPVWSVWENTRYTVMNRILRKQASPNLCASSRALWGHVAVMLTAVRFAIWCPCGNVLARNVLWLQEISIARKYIHSYLNMWIQCTVSEAEKPALVQCHVSFILSIDLFT